MNAAPCSGQKARHVEQAGEAAVHAPMQNSNEDIVSWPRTSFCMFLKVHIYVRSDLTENVKRGGLINFLSWSGTIKTQPQMFHVYFLMKYSVN